ncbi:MAG: hypothetical protein PHY64_01400 [Eubacteriales bacterium]|nr:hypothetical protein [Eubacteriales bacterium]
MKRVLSVLLSLCLALFATASVAETQTASPKEEIVYGLLQADGTPTAVYVVNLLTGGGNLLDYGDYSAVQNLTDAEPISQTGDKITVSTTADRFYYQGTLQSKALPWTVAIAYTLDSETIPADKLAGKSGALAIHIAVTQNPDVSETFYLNYALQIAVTLNPACCGNIHAENATVAEAAGQKQLSFTALPGQGADITVTADVINFAMDAVTLTGIKMNLNLSVDSEAFTEQATQLSDAIASLDDGAGDLQTGASQLADGLTQYLSGVASLTDGLTQLADGAEALSTGAASLNDGLASLTAQNETLVNAALALQQAAFDAANAQLSKSGLPTLTPENYAQVLSASDQLADVKAQLDGITQFVHGLQSYAGGVAQLGDGTASLAEGAASLSDSLAALPTSAEPLSASGTELQTGADSLSSGLTSYKEGTAELRTQTEGLPDEIGAQIDEALGGITGNGDAVVSFVSDQNTHVAAVQFVLKTEAITLPEAVPEAEPQPEPETFWQKLTALFGF